MTIDLTSQPDQRPKIQGCASCLRSSPNGEFNGTKEICQRCVQHGYSEYVQASDWRKFAEEKEKREENIKDVKWGIEKAAGLHESVEPKPGEFVQVKGSLDEAVAALNHKRLLQDAGTPIQANITYELPELIEAYNLAAIQLSEAMKKEIQKVATKQFASVEPVAFATREGGVWQTLKGNIAAIKFADGSIWDVKLECWRNK